MPHGQENTVAGLFYYLTIIAKRTSGYAFIGFFIFGCAGVKKLAIEKDIPRMLNQSEIFSSHFTGFSLFDVATGEYVAGYQSTHKFTPASNTKLLTLYTTLKTFPDSIPAFLFTTVDSTLFVHPTGDPTLLYRPFSSQKAFDQLNAFKNVAIVWPQADPEPFGAGWAWDDYLYDFQPERSWWPIYGNVVNFRKKGDSLKITPSFFGDFVEVCQKGEPETYIKRDRNFNLFQVCVKNDTSDLERDIPFLYSQALFMQLLSDTLNRKVYASDAYVPPVDTLFSQDTDSVLAAMLKPSDNFLAEQLLLMAARWHGHREVQSFIEQVKTTWLSPLNEMVWVDGSGLSRYNLISPVDQVRLLSMCLDAFGWDRMTALLPKGGEGTLEGLYLVNEEEPPFIFAKTGTLSNNHNLSGFLITRSGKRMIFSLMNNHYTRPKEEVKQEMERFLRSIKDAY